MKTCLILINKLSGNFGIVDEKSLQAVFGADYDVETLYISEDFTYPQKKYDRIVVCGGDGTLNHLINAINDDTQLFYCPFGTLNETARGNRFGKDFILSEVGVANGEYFSYVLAAGTFTPLGYSVKTKTKQHYKALAYISHVAAECKVSQIPAKISVNGNDYDDIFSLIMIIDSPRCFGFNFNKLYKPNDGAMHLLTIKAPKHKGFLGLIKMFFPFFRAFFIGFKKPYSSKSMRFTEVNEVTVQLKNPVAFCADGEQRVLSGVINANPTKLNSPVQIVTQKTLNEYYKEGRKI